MNIARDYAGWFPLGLIRAGINKLPSVLKVPPGELDTTTVLRCTPQTALFIAGADDRIAPADEVQKLSGLARPGSRYILVPHATHEAVTYFFNDLAAPVIAWLEQDEKSGGQTERKTSRATGNSIAGGNNEHSR